MSEIQHIPFPDIEMPTLADYDVIMGSAGICVALASARSGMRVAVVEAFPIR